MNTWAIINKLFVCPIVTYWKIRYILESFFLNIFPSFIAISYLISNFDTLIKKIKKIPCLPMHVKHPQVGFGHTNILLSVELPVGFRF